MKKNILIFFFSIIIVQVQAQLVYPIVGSYNGKSAQGMVIYENRAFVFNDGGRCRVLNLNTGKIEKEFLLGSAPLNPHVNTACFGKEKPISGNLPYMYVSETRGQFRCFVEQLIVDSSLHVQTITAKVKGKPLQMKTWIVDIKNNFLYGITRDYKKLNDKGEFRNTMYKLRLPKVSEGRDVVLTEKDIYEKYDLYFASGIQGGKIKNNYLYLTTGREQTAEKRGDSKRAIYVIDLQNKRIKNVIDMTYITVNEPEDIDFYKGNILLFCGQNGGIYKVK